MVTNFDIMIKSRAVIRIFQMSTRVDWNARAEVFVAMAARYRAIDYNREHYEIFAQKAAGEAERLRKKIKK